MTKRVAQVRRRMRPASLIYLHQRPPPQPHPDRPPADSELDQVQPLPIADHLADDGAGPAALNMANFGVERNGFIKHVRPLMLLPNSLQCTDKRIEQSRQHEIGTRL